MPDRVMRDRVKRDRVKKGEVQGAAETKVCAACGRTMDVLAMTERARARLIADRRRLLAKRAEEKLAAKEKLGKRGG